MDFGRNLAKSFGRPGNPGSPAVAEWGLPLVWQLGRGVWDSGPEFRRKGQLIPAGNEDLGKTGQGLPGIFAVKVRDALEME